MAKVAQTKPRSKRYSNLERVIHRSKKAVKKAVKSFNKNFGREAVTRKITATVKKVTTLSPGQVEERFKKEVQKRPKLDAHLLALEARDGYKEAYAWKVAIAKFGPKIAKNVNGEWQDAAKSPVPAANLFSKNAKVALPTKKTSASSVDKKMKRVV
ncbi:MAG: hypothetical protein NTZ44_01065 [Candidatus Nomurabacteria bacterium]|nr:hypothetical protein [Candidatus Nomurabacteria bacterium]